MTEKEAKRRYKEARKREERENELRVMRSSAKKAMKNLEEQRKYWHDKYLQLEAVGDFEQANWAVNMFTFMQNLYKLTQRYIELLDAKTAIESALGLLHTLNKQFGTIVGISAGGLSRSMIRNLKKFKRSIGRFSKETTRIMEAFNSIFGNGKRKKKGGISSEEIYRKNLEKNQDIIDEYERQNGGSVSPTATRPTSAPASPDANGGIGDPNDF